MNRETAIFVGLVFSGPPLPTDTPYEAWNASRRAMAEADGRLSYAAATHVMGLEATEA